MKVIPFRRRRATRIVTLTLVVRAPVDVTPAQLAAFDAAVLADGPLHRRLVHLAAAAGWGRPAEKVRNAPREPTIFPDPPHRPRK